VKPALAALWLTACASPSLEVIDLHVDLPYRLRSGVALDDADASPARLARGGVALVVLPLFVREAQTMEPAAVRAEYERTYAIAAQAPLGVERLYAFEGADGFADRPTEYARWMARGACLVGLVHRRSNALAGSSQEPDRARRTGLSDAGRTLVEAVYAAGGLVDVAHASDAAFDDIAAIARRRGAPLVDSHTGMRALVAIERNLDDARLREVAASNGVVGIDLHSGHLSRRPGFEASLDVVADHVLHAIAAAGGAHVALGSDLDGGITAPTDADGAASWPRLAAILRERGLDDDALAAVFHDNARRVLGWTLARGCQGAPSGGP
jgi:membrane dipeptidase